MSSPPRPCRTRGSASAPEAASGGSTLPGTGVVGSATVIVIVGFARKASGGGGSVPPKAVVAGSMREKASNARIREGGWVLPRQRILPERVTPLPPLTHASSVGLLTHCWTHSCCHRSPPASSHASVGPKRERKRERGRGAEERVREKERQ